MYVVFFFRWVWYELRMCAKKWICVFLFLFTHIINNICVKCKDCRHYNAWYGLATISHQQQNYDVAIHQFEKALSINGMSIALYCSAAYSYSCQGQYNQAIQKLDTVLQKYPNNPRALFQKSLVLLYFISTHSKNTHIKKKK